MHSDAFLLAEMTGTPTVAWGVLWIAASLAVCALLLRRQVKRLDPGVASQPHSLYATPREEHHQSRRLAGGGGWAFPPGPSLNEIGTRLYPAHAPPWHT